MSNQDETEGQCMGLQNLFDYWIINMQKQPGTAKREDQYTELCSLMYKKSCFRVCLSKEGEVSKQFLKSYLLRVG